MYPDFNEYRSSLTDDKISEWVCRANDHINEMRVNKDSKLITASAIIALDMLEDYHQWIADCASRYDV